MIFITKAWHSRGQRFDPAYLHQRSWNLIVFTTFSFFSSQKVVLVMFKNHSRLSFRPLVFHLKIKYSRGGISWLVSRDQNKEAFDYLVAYRTEIENKLGVSLTWSRGEDTKSSKVCYRLNDVSIENEEDWPRMAKFHTEWSKKFYDVIVPYLRDKYLNNT